MKITTSFCAIVAILSFTPISVHGQYWESSYVDILYDYDHGDFLRVKKQKDTLVQGVDAIVFSANLQSYSQGWESVALPDIVLKAENSHIHYYDSDLDSFYLIYDFNLEAGDSYQCYCPEDETTFEVNIDSTGTKVFPGSIIRKIQYITSEPAANSNCAFLSNTIIEGVGNLGYLLPTDLNTFSNLVCYEDENINFGNTPTGECIALVSTTNISNADLEIYPNPVTDILTIEGAEIMEYSIFSSAGELVQKGAGNRSNQLQIDVGRLSPGLWFMRMTLKDGVLQKSFIKL